MKRFLLLALALFTIHCSLFTLDASAQSRTNRIYRNCPGTTTKAAVAIDVAGNITVTPCSGKTVITNGVKVYRALLTQTGTDAPVATVLENSLGGTVVWTRSGAGTYLATLAGAFPVLKTFASCPTGLVDGTQDPFLAVPNTNNVSITNTLGLDENVFSIQILVYP